MRRGLAVAVVFAMALPACGGGSQERVVRVDFQHDEFASHYWRFFPGEIAAHPGDTVVFRQEWTGEPHSVTFGKLFDEARPKFNALEKKYADFDEATASPDDLARAEAEYEAVFADVPTFFPEEADAYPSATAPCYLADGKPPTKRGRACPEREQPTFDGTYAFYSSGYIPPSGPTGNTYRILLADDLEPGTYGFYCVIHFPYMQGKLDVREPGADLPSPATVNEEARSEINVLAGPLRKAYGAARAGRATYEGDPIPLPMAGYHSSDEFTVAIDEFMPRTVRTKVNEPVTWSIVGAHTISFDVPRYVPIYRVRQDGTVKRNPVVDRAAGGSPKAPEVDFSHPTRDIDGGTWDGSGFFSSGLLGSEPFTKYTVRVSKAGRYRFACLVHPNMVGTLVVERD